jgi:hypothetical protein
MRIDSNAATERQEGRSVIGERDGRRSDATIEARVMNALIPNLELEAPSTAARRPGAWHELATRRSGAALVRLFWRPREDDVFVYVRDEFTGDDFAVHPSSDDPLAAFYHPYALRRPQQT